MVVGGQAVLLYGEPRATQDIDITLGVDVDSFDKVLKAVRTVDLIPISAHPQKFAQDTRVLPMQESKTGLRVDLIFSFSNYERQAIKRINKKTILGTQVCYASLDDIIIHKVFSGRTRDIEDVETILLKNKTIDQRYILKWLDLFDQDGSQDCRERYLSIQKRISSVHVGQRALAASTDHRTKTKRKEVRLKTKKKEK